MTPSFNFIQALLVTNSFCIFFDFLGPAAYKLNYWGDGERKTNRRRKNMAMDPLNQYFLTLVRLKLNLRVVDLAYRFGISTSLVSKYFITWVCYVSFIINLMKLIGLLLLHKFVGHCHVHFKKSTLLHTQSMQVKYLCKFLLI